MNITTDERNLCLSLLQKIVYSESPEEYDDYYVQLVDKAPIQVVDYFHTNWHENREEWCSHYMIGNLGNETNNRLESLNGKMKEEMERNNYLSSFAIAFFQWLSGFNRENNFKASKNFIKKPHFAINCTEWEKQYSNYLTIAAFKYVKIELDHHEHITFWDKNNIENQVDKLNINENYFMKCKSLEITTTYKSCECRHWLSFYLPCRHIFAVRRHYDLSLFSEELCAVR